MKIKNRLLTILLVIITAFSLFGCNIALNSEDIKVLNNLTEKSIICATVKVRSFGEKKWGYDGKEYYEGADGSGVIFKEEDSNSGTTFYVLTNNHVVYIGINGYKVFNSYGDEFKASLVCHSPNYDLAVVKFTADKTKRDYKTLTISKNDVSLGGKIIAIGNPLGQLNAITMGKVEGFTKINLTDVSQEEINIDFPIVSHTAPINSGSSGGALLNYNYEICGINYACDRGVESDNFIHAYAIPSSKILEFLKNNGIEI